jgi:hypothetical protein
MPLDGRMAFVPEGQADRSQALGAWIVMHRASRPRGTVEVMVRDIVVDNGVHAALETLGIPVERYVGVKSEPRSILRLRSCCPSGTKHILPFEALIKLALMGVLTL